MNNTTWNGSKISDYFDLRYFARFILLLLALYYFNICYIAVIDPQGRVYSPFLDHYFNYINWIRNSILYTSNFITHLFGVNSYVLLPYRLKIPHGASVETVYACLGLELMSFWIAFVLTYKHKDQWKNKVWWTVFGLFCIWFINCCRVSLLLIALQSFKTINKFADHHTIFNLIAYSLIIFLISLYIKSTNKSVRTAVIQDAIS